ncbi:MAG: penicillin acylase family protein [Chitinophagales bacterium]
MHKIILASILSILTIVLIYSLNKSIGSTPPIGNFLSPTHGFWQNTKVDDRVNFSYEIDCPSGSKATVVIDSIKIPHIFADSEVDLYYAQGFVQAQLRLWQMEFQTLYASGRLSEIVGDKALELDRFNRRIGMARAAKISVEEMSKDEQTQKIANAFSDGVNAYIESINYKDLPIEYKLLGYQPEEWSPYKSALLMKYMAFDLTYRNLDVEYTNALKLFGEENFKTLYPDFPMPEDPIIPIGTKWNFKNIDSFKTTIGTNTETLKAELYKNPMSKYMPNKFLGSNNWAVSGTKTSSGKPILCNDPHLGLNLPSIWLAMQLNSKNMNVMGVTIPGAPGIVIGFNDSISWGVTNASRDVINTYSVEYKDNHKKAYKLGNQFVEFTYQVDTIKIKGKKPFIDSVRITVAGSIVYDENFGEQNDRKHLAVYWRAIEPSNELMTFYKLNHAKGHQDYLDALNTFGCPGQNFVYADVNNNIAIKEQGHFMLRTTAKDGRFVEPLATINLNKLKSSIPNNQNPYILNPSRGFVSSANQKPVDGNYPYSTGGDYENYRNRVINAELSAMKNIKPKDMMALQGNNLSLLAKEVLPTLLANLDTIKFKDSTSLAILKTFSKWNYFANYSYSGPSYFYKWFETIERLTWDEFKSEKYSMIQPENYVLSNLIATRPNYELFDIEATTKTENAKDIINLAFEETTKYFKEFYEQNKTTRWQIYKNTSVTHLAKIKAFSITEIPIGGYSNIVNATAKDAGASWRMIVDFAGGKPTAYGIYPGGQSGSPASKFYNNMVPLWANNEYYPLSFYLSKSDALNSLKK